MGFDVDPFSLCCFQYLRLLAVAYEKTQELARDLRGVGCGDLDVEGRKCKNWIEMLINLNSLQRLATSVPLGFSMQSHERQNNEDNKREIHKVVFGWLFG